MTQIIAALTQDYVLVASDRQLTWVRGPKKGKVAYDNTCKLVSLCGLWGIAYTGFSELQGKPTHEWIGLKLAEKGCVQSNFAAQILREEAEKALKSAPFIIEQQFLISGWVISKESKTPQPQFLLVSNIHNNDGSLKRIKGVRAL